MSSRTSIALLALAVAGFMGSQTAFAEGTAAERQQDRAAVAALPHGDPASAGTPVQTGTRDHGKPVFSHEGQARGDLTGGGSHVVGERSHGRAILAPNAPAS